jgi:starch phosphorylase
MADLLRAGLDVARLRLSPGDFDTHALVLADCRAYVRAQQAIAGAFLDSDRWPRMSILNTARTGCFSSDRAIRECAKSIWRVAPVAGEVP